MKQVIQLETLQVVGGAQVHESEIVKFAKQQSSLEAAWNEIDRSDWMLWLLEAASREELLSDSHATELRFFACWCARRCLQVSKVHGSALHVVQVAERYAEGSASQEELSQAQEEARGGASGAAVVGLPKHVAGAAAQLACFHCGDRVAMTAARWSSWFHMRAACDTAAELAAAKLKWPGDIASFVNLNSEVLAAVEAGALAGQAKALRSILKNPFSGKISTTRWPRNDFGVPLLPDIAAGASPELRKLALSAAQKEQPRCDTVDPSQVLRVVMLLRDYYLAMKHAEGESAAHKQFMASFDAILEAEDFDPVLDEMYVQAYEKIRQELFQSCPPRSVSAP